MIKLFSSSRSGLVAYRPESDFCINMYHKNAGCTECKDVCPAGALIVGRPGTCVAIDEDKCMNCGKCFGACAYGVFRKSGTTEEDFCSLLHEKSEKGALFVSCREKRIAKSYRLECIGELHAVHLLWLMARGVSSFAFHHGACGECRFQNGCEMIMKQINSVQGICSSIKGVVVSFESESDRTLLKVQGFPVFKAQRNTAKPEMNRRDFFKYLGREIAMDISKTAEVFTSSETKVVDFSSDNKKRSQRQVLFRRILASLKGKFDKALQYDRNLPACELEIVQDNCKGCNLCVMLCPTGSLKVQDNKIKCTSETCTGCQVCEKSCVSGGLVIKPHYSV